MTYKKIYFEKLIDLVVTPEGDDFHIAAMMVDEIRDCHVDLRHMVLARWVARLRETYVGIGERSQA